MTKLFVGISLCAYGAYAIWLAQYPDALAVGCVLIGIVLVVASSFSRESRTLRDARRFDARRGR